MIISSIIQLLLLTRRVLVATLNLLTRSIKNFQKNSSIYPATLLPKYVILKVLPKIIELQMLPDIISSHTHHTSNV